MKIIGITGSSGSGKTTIASIFEKKYISKLIDADKVVKEMSIPGTEYMNKIKEDIGIEFFNEDGYLNRKKLAEKIYTDKEALKKLNNLTFKYVVEEIKNRVSKTELKTEFVIIDAPLLIESELDDFCDYIIAVIAGKEIQIQRICERDNLDRKIAESRLQIQKEDEFYVDSADFVIYNNGNQELLEYKVEEIVEKINKDIR